MAINEILTNMINDKCVRQMLGQLCQYFDFFHLGTQEMFGIVAFFLIDGFLSGFKNYMVHAPLLASLTCFCLHVFVVFKTIGL